MGSRLAPRLSPGLQGSICMNKSNTEVPRSLLGAAKHATPAAGDREDGSGVGGPLGIYARTDSAFEVIDEQTGEITRFKLDEKTREYVQELDPKRHRAERYALKSIVNRLLPTSRTSKCCRWRIPKKAVQVHRSTEHGKAFYSGLEVCASVWACPVCAAKISERRRAELVTAVALAKSMGLHVKLLTLTVPHGVGDDLPTLLEQIRKSWRSTSTSRAGQKLRKLLGIKGTIRALEVTHGQNGFHPHLHVLLFLEQ
ncbi:hypothetical protein BKN49_22580, partial [Pseudomonas aeruginosa]